MERYSSGPGSLFVYTDAELRAALDQHEQLTRHLWPGAFAIVRRARWGEFQAELRLRDVGPTQLVEAPTVGALLEVILPIIAAAAPDGWMTRGGEGD